MKKFSGLTLLAAAAAAVLISEAPVAEAANCNVMELSPCQPVVQKGEAPSETCCKKLKEQDPKCFCVYAKNPMLSNYFTSENEKKFSSCDVAFPKKCT
ncbi:hypothetical protein TIFTF001_001954 [Ficus carica]|uniref:Bifunctional inhibitor/plant lipid transfer protein/seed storage helical domain-containing protein n=1 Tax=Ficus carica TaxID=3494 RepID=A0AA87ZB42_FICCA|nr:hypothetical protein TIFTF001_001954 [Ficus carica]